MDYLGSHMEDFCSHLRELVLWLNREDSAPIRFAEPGFRRDLFTVPQPFLELYLATEGSLRIDVRDQSHVLRPGDLALANAHFGNSGGEVAGAFRYGCISIEIPDRPQFAAWSRAPLLLWRRAPDVDRLKTLYADVAKLYHGPEHPFREVLLKASLLQLLVSAGDTGAGQSASTGLQNPVVRRAIAYMQERRADAQLDLARIARYARVSPSHLVRLFQSHLGTSPMRYLTQLRIRHAESLLRRSQLAIKEIAYLVGFSDQLYFSRVFHQVTGNAPRDYRKRLSDG